MSSRSKSASKLRSSLKTPSNKFSTIDIDDEPLLRHRIYVRHEMRALFKIEGENI